MNRLAVLILIISISADSCTKTTENIDISGKWYTFSEDYDYTEYEITSNEIHPFSHSMGNMAFSDYEIKGDTLTCISMQYSKAIRKVSDSIFIMTNADKVDSFFKLDESVITFHEINYQDDSIFNIFYEQFTERAYNCWIKYGYFTEEELQQSFIDTNTIEETLIPINR